MVFCDSSRPYGWRQGSLGGCPFAEQLAILDRLDDSGRVRVLLEILGRPVPVEIRPNSFWPSSSEVEPIRRPIPLRQMPRP